MDLGYALETDLKKSIFLPMKWNVEGEGEPVYVSVALVDVDIFSVINKNH